MAATYEPIATTTLGSAASSITFSSIPSTYTDLRLVLVSKTGSTTDSFGLQFNGDTGSNYSYLYLYGNGTSAISGSNSGTTVTFAGYHPGTVPGVTQCDIFSYAGSTYKTFLSNSAADANGSGYAFRSVCLWRSTAAINQVTIMNSTFASGDVATLYGIKSA